MKIIPTQNQILVEDVSKSFLNEEVSSGSSTIELESSSNFSATNKFVLIGDLGNEKSEIIAIDSISSDTITLSSNTEYAHPQGTAIYELDYDKIDIAWSGTIDGGKDILDTIDIQPDSEETIYTDDAKTEGYYFVRFKNSLSTDTSDYSDPIPWGGYDRNTVAKCIDYALKRNKLDSFTKFIDFDFCVEEINSAINYINGKKKKWSNLQSFDYELGTTSRGENEFDLPDNVWDNSYKSILDVRVGKGKSLIYKDKREWNELMVGVAKTEVTSISENTSITVDNAIELDDDGTVMIAGEDIDYTGITGNTLTGVTDTSSVSVGDTVWQGDYQEGDPLYYTIYGGNLYTYPLTSSTDANKTVFVDFWTEAPEVDSYADTLDVERYDMIKHYLTWAIRMEIKNDGIRDTEDGDYLQFRDILRDAIRGDITGQHYMGKPTLNTINYNTPR